MLYETTSQYSLYQILFLVIAASIVDGGTIKVPVYATVSDTLNLKWKYETNSSQLNTLSILHESHEIVSCLRNHSSVSCTTIKDIKYSTMLLEDENIFKLMVYNLTYGDRGIYHGFINHEGTSEHLMDYDARLKGPPYICHNPNAEVLTFNEVESPMLNISVCGFPRPRYTWVFGMNTQNLGLSEKTLQPFFKYQFFVQLPILVRNMCGMYVKLRVENGYGMVEVSTKIEIHFPPPVVNDVQFHAEKPCYELKWLPIESGNCPSQYEIEFFTNRHQESSSVLTPSFSESIKFCVPNKKWSNAQYYARIRSKYKNQNGNWSSDITSIQLATASKSSKTGLIIGLTLGLIIFLILCLMLFFYIKKERTKNGNGLWSPKKPTPNKKTDFVDVSLLNMTSPSSKGPPSPDHYVDMSGNKQTYTGMTTDSYKRPTYSKLNTDDRVYENMDEIKNSVLPKPPIPLYEDVGTHAV